MILQTMFTPTGQRFPTSGHYTFGRPTHYLPRLRVLFDGDLCFRRPAAPPPTPNVRLVVVCMLDVWRCFCIFIDRSSILCRSGNYTGLPGDLVPGPLGLDSGQGGSEGVPGPPRTLYKNIVV